jgi:tripartite-type tricarboxylate transporter receptor subunit TctC
MENEKMLGKLAIVVLMLVLAFSLAACGKSDSPAKEKAKEKYPNRPITVFVNYGAGGSSDLGTRALMAVVEKDLGVPINIINKPGPAAGSAGANFSRPNRTATRSR